MEAFTLLTQYYILLPPNLAQQLKWSRFVNMKGLPGHNISCDLHNEHLNRLLKVAIEGLGANKSKHAITRAGKAIGVLSCAAESYDKEVGVTAPSDRHSDKGSQKDLKTILQQLMERDVFNKETASKLMHKSFPHLETNLIKTVDEKLLKEWMVENFSKALRKSPPISVESDNEDDQDN